MKAMLERWWERFVASQVLAIDGLVSKEPGTPRSPTFKTVFAAISVAVLLTVMNFYVLDGAFQSRISRAAADLVSHIPDNGLRLALLDAQPLYRHVFWALGCFVLYFAIPATLVRTVLHEPLRNFGLSPRGFFRHLPIYLVLFVPVLAAVVAVSYTDAFQRTYPFYHNPRGIADLMVWDFFYCLQFFALEFFFRGFMIHSMKHRLGSMAVFAMVVPYCMIHFQKPMPEALAAILAGTVLGVLSLRTNTIWGGVFIHSAVAVSMDWASLLQRGWRPW